MLGGLLHNRFRILKKLGEGRTGTVWLAEDTLLKRTVALKRARGKTEPERKSRGVRLLHEAEFLARIDHPNVVGVHDFIDGETSVTLVMELVKGVPFKSLYRKGAMAQHEYLPYLEQLLSALEAVHREGIIHRDVNPNNILLSEAGVVKLTDFGLACSADDAAPRRGGTIGYMAPESLRKSARLTFAVDIYALGFLSFQAFLGKPDFQKLYGASSSLEWARWLLSRERFKTLDEIGKPVSQGLSAIVERMLEKAPGDRYAMVADVRKDLDRVAGHALKAPESLGFAAGMRRILPSLLSRGPEVG